MRELMSAFRAFPPPPPPWRLRVGHRPLKRPCRKQAILASRPFRSYTPGGRTDSGRGSSACRKSTQRELHVALGLRLLLQLEEYGEQKKNWPVRWQQGLASDWGNLNGRWLAPSLNRTGRDAGCDVLHVVCFCGKF
jgi:hypothetical protein